MLIIRQNELQAKRGKKRQIKSLYNDKRINLLRRTLEIYMLPSPEQFQCQYIKQILTDMEGEVDNNTMTIGI